MHLTSHITHSNGYAPYIAYYRSNGVDQFFRKLKPKPKLNPPNAHRSQIKICENRQTQNVQFPFMPNAFRILKPIQNAFECFVTQVQTRLPKTKCVWPMKINVICTVTRLLGRPQPQMYPPVALNQHTLVNRTHKHYIYICFKAMSQTS